MIDAAGNISTGYDLPGAANTIKTNRMTRGIQSLLVLLFIVCVFDPANQLLGLKYIFFVGVWVLFLMYRLMARASLTISLKLVYYLLAFVFVIPIISIAYFLLTNPSPGNFDGITYFKPYLFLTIVIVLYTLRIDLIKAIVAICTWLSVVTLILFLLSYLQVSLVYFILEVGEMNSMTTSGVRSLGGIDFLSVDFQSSPLIVFAIAYYVRMLFLIKGKKMMWIIVLLFINMGAMFVGATRNNMFASIVLPTVVFIWYSRHKRASIAFIGLLLMIFVVSNISVIQGMLDSDEKSNSVKLDFFNDYMKMFDRWDILLFGQGLGSFFNSTHRGMVSVSELTYFEFIRRFGLILCILIFSMLLYPLHKLFWKKFREDHYIYIAYFFYLIICFSNPFLMSSTGMLLLSLVLYKTYSTNVKNLHYGNT